MKMTKELEVKLENTVLTPEQRLAVREKQVQILGMRNNANSLMEKSRQLEQELQQLVNSIANSMGIDLKQYGFNLDTLEWAPLAQGRQERTNGQGA